MRSVVGRATTAAETASQISDDECQGGICPSCRLAVNKDTGRLKWCMGGNDIWRTRIRFMLLIPAVILPVTIIIIALSKSTVIGKLSRSPATATTAAAADVMLTDEPSAVVDRNFIPATIQNDIEQSEEAERHLHPDAETSFIPPESLIATPSPRRHKRDVSQKSQRRSIDNAMEASKQRRRRGDQQQQHSADGKSSTRHQRELQVNSSRRTPLARQARGSAPMAEVPAARQQSSSSAQMMAATAEDVDCEDDEDEDYESSSISEEDSDEDDSEELEEEEDDDDSEEESSEKDGVEVVASLDNDAVHWQPRPRNDDDRSSTSDSEEYDDDSGHYQSFWKSDWSEESIRKAQARLMLKYMDRTADPCQDFYQYACGNWERYNRIPKDKAGYDTFETLRESLDWVLKQLLEEPPRDGIDTYADSAVLKAKNHFRSCMNHEILERRMEGPLVEFLDELGGWPILRPNWDPDTFDWQRLIAVLRLYNNDVLISEWVGPDIKNSDQYVIQFDQTTLGLPTKDYFLQSANSVYLLAYKNYLIRIATLLGASDDTAKVQADELILFETQLANITLSPDERHDLSDLYRKMTLDELHLMIPQIDWHRYLTIVLARPVDLSESVVLYATKYLQGLVKLISDTPPRIVANYLLWRFVRHRVNNLDDRFQEAKQAFYFVLFGREKSPSRWKNCVAQVNSNMGMAVGSIFVRKYFNEMSKNDTLLMTHEIQRSFRELLNQSSWLDSITKQVAGEKVEAMQLRIGYPGFILDPSELDERYKDVTIHPERYFENTLGILRHLTRNEQAKLGSRVNRTVWNAAPAIVNAYYSRNKNQIMFPAGILQPPFYHRYFPRSLNYGGIGVVIGHEITHGFDDKGRLFDKYGNMHRWWSDETISEFDRRALCLVEQFSKYYVKEVAMTIDGVNTQGENIADNGGIKQAFRAYEKWLSLNGEAGERLPGVEASGRQLFFLNFAQVWCGSMRPEAMRNKLRTAVHSPGKYRVIGTLSNSEEFAKVFGCPRGTPMNPVKKCLVW